MSVVACPSRDIGSAVREAMAIEPVSVPATSAQESWQGYRLLADNAIDVVFEADLGTRITWVSPSVRQVLGWSPDEFVGQSAPALVHPDDLPGIIEMATAINDGSMVHTARVRMLRSDGGFTSMQLRGRPALAPDGSVVGHIITMQDTTERDEALRALAVLSEGNRVLARVSSEQQLLEQMCDAIVQTGQYPLAWYGERAHDDRRTIRKRAVSGPSADYAHSIDITWGDDPLGSGPTGRAMRTGVVQVRDDYGPSPDFGPWREAAEAAGLRSSISLPVRIEGEVEGVLVVASTEPRSFDEQAVHLLETLASDLGLGLHRLRSLDRLREQTARLQGVFDSQFDPFVLLEAVRDESGSAVDLRYVVASDAALEHNGLTREQMIGHLISELFPGQVEDGTVAGYLNVIKTGEPIVLDDYLYFHEPRQEWHRYDIRAVKSGDGVAITFRDVTSRFEAARRLIESEERYRLLAENASDLVWQTDGAGRIIWVSESAKSVLGYESGELIGRGLDLIHPDDHARVREAQGQLETGTAVEGEVRLLKKDGSWMWMGFSAQAAATGDDVTHVITLRDIDTEVRARDALIHAIGHDPLTGMAARPTMIQRIHEALSRLPARRLAVVMCIGVDRLSAVNDAYTHSAGDIVLTTVATRIVEAVGNPDHVGRGTGVEFLVLMPDVASGGDAASVAERIITSCRGPIALGDNSVEVTVSVGISIGDRRSDAEQLVRDASAAMGQAKTDGRDRFAFADASLADQARRRFDVERRIRDGLPEDRFIPVFQPIVDLATGQLDGYEALVRYQREDGSLALPSQFLPIAELGPLIADIDLALLRQSLAALRSIPAPLSVGVNISSVTLTRPGYLALIEQVLRESGVSLSRVHLEITETALLGEIAGIVDAMQAISAIGARWYVDDFGTGFSSISHLRDLPIAGLKLDVSFSTGIREGDTTSMRLAQALAGLAGGLGLDTVAEGIEGTQEAQVLLLQGWRHGQGHLYGGPAPLA